MALAACSQEESQTENETSNDLPPPQASEGLRPRPPTSTNQRVAFQTGSFESGTEPGRFERNPALEPGLRTVKLGPFSIDALPYPNDPSKPFRRESTQSGAATLCAERGGRLCTELEWERACKGPKSAPFASGENWGCSDDPLCPSVEGVLGLGSELEWTGSSFGTDSPRSGKGVIRGANPTESQDQHRCSRRRAEPDLNGNKDKTGQKPALFRCCFGAPNGEKLIEPREKAPYRFAQLTPAELKQLLRDSPITSDLAETAGFFDDPEASRTVLSRGTGDTKGFDFTTRPLYWSPKAGSEFLVVTGKTRPPKKGPTTSFVLLYHVVGTGKFSLTSSFIMPEERGPLALAYSASIRPRLHFSSCWGCPGETGKLLYRDGDTAVILQP